MKHRYIKVLGVTIIAMFGGISSSYANERNVVAKLPCLIQLTENAKPIIAICEMWTWQGRRFSTAYTVNDRKEISTAEYLPDGSQTLYKTFAEIIDSKSGHFIEPGKSVG